jgi:Na+/H+ antiporter NhaC
MVTLVTNNIKGKGITEAAYTIVVKSMLWNLFSWTMLLLGIGVTIFSLGFGRFKLGKATEESNEFTKAHIKKEESYNKSIEEYPKNSMNLIVPVAILLISTIFFFWWTGKGEGKSFFHALSSAKFSVSIFSGVILTLLFTTIYFMFQKISLAEIETHIIIGGEKILSLVVILILSWALTSVTQDLGFNKLVSASLIKSIPKFLIPAILFLFSGIISYMLGSSWATWALMMPLAINFSINSGVNIAIMIGTVWAGGAVADIVSPLSAQMADISFGEHLTTSFPYVVAGVFLTTVAYIIVGVMI